jgi:hypothetical protein
MRSGISGLNNLWSVVGFHGLNASNITDIDIRGPALPGATGGVFNEVVPPGSPFLSLTRLTLTRLLWLLKRRSFQVATSPNTAFVNSRSDILAFPPRSQQSFSVSALCSGQMYLQLATTSHPDGLMRANFVAETQYPWHFSSVACYPRFSMSRVFIASGANVCFRILQSLLTLLRRWFPQ